MQRLVACAFMTAMISGVLPHPAAAQAANFQQVASIPFAAGASPTSPCAVATSSAAAEPAGDRREPSGRRRSRGCAGGDELAADGYALVLAVGTAISVALFKSLPFDAEKDFAPISTVAHFDMLLLTKSSSPIRTLDDLLGESRKRGERMNLGTTLAGSSQFLAGALFRSVAGIKATQVPFRTTPDVLLALLRDDVDVAIESYGALKSSIDDGQPRAAQSRLQTPPRSGPADGDSRDRGRPDDRGTAVRASRHPRTRCRGNRDQKSCRGGGAQAHGRTRR
jgi:tripartite-type tricarboxylate transporter receptor subunit TctC